MLFYCRQFCETSVQEMYHGEKNLFKKEEEKKKTSDIVKSSIKMYFLGVSSLREHKSDHN